MPRLPAWTHSFECRRDVESPHALYVLGPGRVLAIVLLFHVLLLIDHAYLFPIHVEDPFDVHTLHWELSLLPPQRGFDDL